MPGSVDLDGFTETCQRYGCGKTVTEFTIVTVARETTGADGGHEPTDADPLVVLCHSCDGLVLNAMQLLVSAATGPACGVAL